MFHLRAGFPEQVSCLDPEALERLIRLGTEKAICLGLVYETDISRFIEYHLFLEEKLPQWMLNILQASGLSGEEKMDHIDNGRSYLAKG